MKKYTSKHVALLGATAITLALMPVSGVAQQAMTVTPQPNTEPDSAPVGNSSGFVFAVDGVPVNADPVIEDRIRRTDIALANADVQVQFNGLNATPRLNLELATAAQYGPGFAVQLRTETNYPAFITRSEIRVYDQGAIGAARLLATVPVDANGAAELTVPEGRQVVAVLRVYDASGRYDETTPLALGQPDARNLTVHEDGADATAVRNIRVRGGAVTVSASNVSSNATLYTLGEAVRADGRSRLVVERILPPGDYAVDVAVTGPGQNTKLSRQMVVPASEWLYVGSGELTYSGIGSDAGPETSGRLSFYADGVLANGTEVTASLDTGEGDLGSVFQRLTERDPTTLADRLTLKDGYPTFGDDSSIVDNTPTSGRVYLRVQNGANFGVFGDYQARLEGSSYLRNERTLYGVQGHVESDGITADGEARAALDVYVAQPDQIVGRDVFRGTGGSVYFLSGSDLTAGTATVAIELRDGDTGRVIERETLVEGRDYEIDYIQGVIILTRPLDGTATDGIIQSNPGGDINVNLTAQYEYSPVGIAVGGITAGARAEGWVTDDVRIGVTAMRDETGITEQQSEAVDLRYTLGQNSYLQVDYARSNGAGFEQLNSLDGGLTLDTNAAVAGSGEAVRVAGQGDFADMGLSGKGTVAGYYEKRTAGFSTLDYQVTAATGDETLYGLSLSTSPREGLSYGLTADRYENAVGDKTTELGAEVDVMLSQQLRLTAAAEYLEKRTASVDGSRVDLGAKLTYAMTDETEIYAFGQQAVATDDLDAFDRYGVGIRQSLSNDWEVAGEVSNGTGGWGARLTAQQDRENNESTYFGYEIDAGRALDAGVSQADNGGKFVLGGRRALSDNAVMFGENVYDVFGSETSLTSAYGVEYQANDFLSYSVGFNFGQVRDDVNGNFERKGLSLGMRYEDEDTTARVLGEVRIDDADTTSSRTSSETYIIAADAAYTVSPSARWLLNLRAAQTNAASNPDLDGSFVEASLGYALRPVNDERFNMLAMLRYLHDDYGQTVDGVPRAGDVQNSLVASVEGNYDIDEYWTIGAKLGYRATQSGPDMNSLSDNRAVLAVVNARYHLVHDWDVLLEARQFSALDAETSEFGLLGTVYKQVGQGTQVGVGYNFGSFSDNLTDLTQDDGGLFVNIVASF